MTPAAPVPLIDELMPRFDEFERHEILVRAVPAAVYAALRRVDLLGSRVIRWLRLYWRIVGPFSGLIRIALLRAVAREATR